VNAHYTFSRQRGFASALTLKRVRDLCGGFPDVVLEVAGIPKGLSTRSESSGPAAGDRDRQYLAGTHRVNRARNGHVQVNRINRRREVSAALSKEVTRFHLDSYGALSVSREMRDATSPLSQAAETLDRSERRKGDARGFATAGRLARAGVFKPLAPFDHQAPLADDEGTSTGVDVTKSQLISWRDPVAALLR
jgi:hypothetical protein